MNFFKISLRIIVAVVALTLIILYLMVHNYVMLISFEKENMEKELAAIKRENELLEIDASHKTGLAQLDRYATEKLAMNKPNKIEFIVFEGS